MLLTLALTAALQGVPPPPVRSLAPTVGRSCARDRLEHAGGKRVVYRGGDRPAEQRRLDELPDANMVRTVFKRGGDGCAIVDVVRRGVSTSPAP